jgi:hypothetical protein
MTAVTPIVALALSDAQIDQLLARVDAERWRRDMSSHGATVSDAQAFRIAVAELLSRQPFTRHELLNVGDRVEWEDSRGDWYPVKIITRDIGQTTYGIELLSGQSVAHGLSTGYAATRFRRPAVPA